MFVAQIACSYAVIAPPRVEYSLRGQRVEARHKHIQFVQLLGISVGFIAQIACTYGMPSP